MRGWVAVLLLAPMFAGCLGPDGLETSRPDGQATDTRYWMSVEEDVHVEATFEVLTRSAGPVTVAGYAWLPDEPVETVVLAIHGTGGMPLVIFGPTPVPGYSLAHRLVDAGRAVVAIDRPGYGNSTAVDETQTHEDHAWVVAQVADQLREGSYAIGGDEGTSFDRVVGLGHSSGARVAMITQAEYGSFDAIVPIARSHAGYTEEIRACANGSSECKPLVEYAYVRNNTDPRIYAYARNVTLEPRPGVTGEENAVMMGCLDCVHPALEAARPLPDPEDATAGRIEGPVLMLLGAEDGIVEPATQEEEEAYFTATDDLTVVVLEDTSHMLWHHLTAEEMFSTLIDWMEARGL